MSNFLNEMKKEVSFTETHNGALAYNTTQSGVLDFFAEASALRNSHDSKIIELFDKSFAENPLLTMKCLFYTRDIRGGQGERRVFKVVLKHLANLRPEIIRLNLNLISEYGRYDDMLVLLDTELKYDVIEIIKNQLNKDKNDKHPSLLAKWLPSCDTSSAKTRAYAKCIRKALGMNEKQYRKMLSELREKIRVTERLLSQKRLDDLDLEKLTSNNYLKYQRAFMRNIPDRWNNYIDRVKDGKSSVKSATLYPYNIVNQVKTAHSSNVTLCDEMWKVLPDYSDGMMESILCMVDVSGSMDVSVSGNVTAMDVAISLGLYVSERVRGPFANHFMTFSSRPEIVEIKGKNLREKVYNISRANWDMSTDLNKAFELILETAVSTNAKQEDIPKKLIIISDMQFDSALSYSTRKRTLFEGIKSKFLACGYEMPSIVFWNVDSKKTAFQVDKDSKNVLLCSGCSPVILKGVLKYNSPMELVLETLNDPRYDAVMV